MTAKSSTLADNLRFWRALVTRPKSIGAVIPSSAALARAMARIIDPGSHSPVLELGPGTGVITHAILARGVAPRQLTLIEYDAEFATRLAIRFPEVNVVEGDAFDVAHTLRAGPHGPFAAIVSGLPLLNFPLVRRRALIEGALARLAPGAPLIQFSYGMMAPVPPPPGFGVTRATTVWANIPPARVWVYRKL